LEDTPDAEHHSIYELVLVESTCGREVLEGCLRQNALHKNPEGAKQCGWRDLAADKQFVTAEFVDTNEISFHRRDIR